MSIRRQILPLLALLLSAAVSGAEDMTEARTDMLEAIHRSVAASASYTGIDALSPRVVDAMAAVRRHAYVPGDQVHMAYLNSPLPIGHGQTISQPLIVALMTEFLDPQPEDAVLEIGTGSGYQAAVLAQLVKQVYTIEIVRPLAERARKALANEGVTNVEVRAGDGYAGWPERAPFDGIIVTAAPEEIPQPLVEQLKAGGHMIIPVGAEGGFQQLKLVEKNTDGSLSERGVLPVSFVPFTRD